MAKTIMILDDSASLRQVVNISLKSAGYQVVQAENGRVALDQIQSVAPTSSCDVNMPVMDGISFVKELKSLPEFKFTPVIMLTTEAGEDKRLVAVSEAVADVVALSGRTELTEARS